MSLTFSTGNINLEEKLITLNLLKLDNAVVAIIWEGDRPQWGSTTLTLSDSTFTQILGDRDSMIGRVIGGYLAKRFERMALVSTHLSQGYRDNLGIRLLELVKHVTEEKNA